MAKLSAREVANDIRSGMDDTRLMAKYGISAQGLKILFRKLLDMGAITQAELSNRSPASDKTMVMAWKCPACGKPQPTEVTDCPDCGVIVAKFLEKEKRKKQQQPPAVEPGSPRISDHQADGFAASKTGGVTEWKCPSCGRQNKDVAICPRCAFVLLASREQRNCPACAKPYPRGLGACPDCGVIFSKVLPQGHSQFDIKGIIDDTKGIIDDIKGMNFREEVLPITAKNMGLLKSDTVFWGVAFLGVTPLIITTVANNDLKLALFSAFFAFIWAVIFKKLILKDSSGWKIPIGAFFFTGIIGIPLMLLIYGVIPSWYFELPSSGNLLASLLGYVFRVGVWEELCKALPLIIYLTWRVRQKELPEPFEIVFIGVASGLGFATFENMQYADYVFQQSVRLTVDYGREGFEHGVKGAMINPMLRNLSLSFAHAVFTGLFAYFLAVGATTQNRQVALFCVGLAVASVLHGLYDWTLRVNEILSIMTVCFSVMLFYAYVSKLRLPEYGPVEGRSQA